MIILSALLLSSAAVEPRIDCGKTQYQIEMNYCAEKDFERADAALNAQWKLTAAEVKRRDADIDRSYDTLPTGYALLLDAQRAWIAYRDAHCISVGNDARGGSMEPMLVSLCRAELTNQRNAQLKALIEEY